MSVSARIELVVACSQVHNPISVAQYSGDGTAIWLDGNAPLDTYQTALSSLSYELEDGIEPPCPLERRVQVTVYSSNLRYAHEQQYLQRLPSRYTCSRDLAI